MRILNTAIPDVKVVWLMTYSFAVGQRCDKRLAALSPVTKNQIREKCLNRLSDKIGNVKKGRELHSNIRKNLRGCIAPINDRDQAIHD